MDDTNTLAVAIDALRAAKKLFDEVLPKFDWSHAFLDAKAIQQLNTTPKIVNDALQMLTAPAQPERNVPNQDPAYPTVPEGSVLIWRRSANTNAFGLRGYWSFDPWTGDVEEFAVNDGRALKLGEIVPRTDYRLTSAELRQNQGSTAPGHGTTRFLARCWDNIAGQIGRAGIDAIRAAQGVKA